MRSHATFRVFSAALTAALMVVAFWPGYLFADDTTAVMREVLKFTISTDKSTYLQGEEIFMLTHRVNLATDTISVLRIDERNESSLQIELTDDTGKTIPRIGGGDMLMWIAGRPIPCHVLKPGETRIDWFRITGLFGRSMKPSSISSFLEPGTYTLRATYRHWWKQDYVSNTTAFTVKAPEGIEKDAWELWTSADILRASTGNKDTVLQKYREFFQRFPNSIYGPRVCNLAMLASQAYIMGQVDNSREWAERFLRDYPESYDADLALTTYLGKAEGTERDSILQNVMVKYSGTRIADIAEKRIQMWREYEERNRK